MKFFTNIALSTWIALAVATLTEGLDGTYQIRHPTTNDDLANDERQLFSPLTTLTTNLFGRAKCRIELRACRRASKGQKPDLDAWEVRASNLSGGGNDSSSKVVQMLQEVIAKARDVDMAAITQALKTPNFDPADKDVLLAEAKTIRSETLALLKTSSALTVEGIPDWIEMTQAVLNATSALTEKVYRQPNPILIGLLYPFIFLFAVIAFIPAVYLWLISFFCCNVSSPGCDPVCYVLAIVFTPAIIVGTILFFVGFIIYRIVNYVEGLIPGQQQRWSAMSDDTCFGDLLTCQYERLLGSIIPTSLDLIEKRG